MDDRTAATTTAAIADIFPNTKTNPALCGAITQELSRGRYDADRVIAWANWRRTETKLFELTELRQAFRDDQPASAQEPDARTAAWRRQRDEIEASYAAGQPEREAMKSFFEHEDDDGLALLKAEFIATCPTEAHAALASRNVRESQILKQGIWAMVKQHMMK